MASAPVSAVIPCFNCAETIERAISSVVFQTLPPAELLVVDDGSNDRGETMNKLTILRDRYKDILHLEIISLNRNSGPSAARNAGWEAATQPYIAFLDSDDAWHPSKIEIQHKWMDENPGIALTSGYPCITKPGEPVVPLPDRWPVREVGRNILLFSNRFHTSSAMLRRGLPYRFRTGMNYCEDYLLWLQIVFNGHRAARFDLPLAFLFKPHFGSRGLTRDIWKLSKGEMAAFRIIDQEGLISSPLRMAITAYIFLKHIRRFLITFLINSRHGHPDA
ncbi:MAG: glycosyltransferase family 2 protein [Nitrospirae bacterium]|nr:glycosyltransferase family 2 protein [Nitrospirota bacterium]